MMFDLSELKTAVIEKQDIILHKLLDLQLYRQYKLRLYTYFY